MKVAILLMQKNERSLLKPWIEYHANLFGIDNIYLYDNGSTDFEVVQMLDEYERKGLCVYREYSSKDDFERKGRIFSDKIKELDSVSPYDFYFPLDCDEFIACETNLGLSIKKSDIVEELSKYQYGSALLMIGRAYSNSPLHPDEYMPENELDKCFFIRNTCKSLGSGFHSGETVAELKKIIRTNIVYFHFHYKPYDQYLESAKNKLEGRIADFSKESLWEYAEKQRPGFHLISNIMSTSLEYYSRFYVQHRIKFQKLRQFLSELGAPLNLLEERASLIPAPIKGFVDKISFQGDFIELEGWCLNSLLKACDKFIIEVDGSLKYVSKLESKPRLDVTKKFPGACMECGFKISFRKPQVLYKYSRLLVKVLDVDSNIGVLGMTKEAFNSWDNMLTQEVGIVEN